MEAELFYLATKKPKPGQPLARVAYTTSTAVSGTTAVPWNVTASAEYGTTASSSGIVVPTTGYYEVSGAITFSSSGSEPYAPVGASKYGYAAITIGGTVYANGTVAENVAASTGTAPVIPMYASFVSDIVHLTGGGTAVTLSAIGSSGLYIWGYEDPALVTGNFMTYLSVVYVSS